MKEYLFFIMKYAFVESSKLIVISKCVIHRSENTAKYTE